MLYLRYVITYVCHNLCMLFGMEWKFTLKTGTRVQGYRICRPFGLVGKIIELKSKSY